MLPIQDAVPSGKAPLATIALLVFNMVWFALQWAAIAPGPLASISPFAHPSTVHFVLNLLFLWLFGDNVEARLGRPGFVAVYMAGGTLGAYAAWTVTGGAMATPLGATCAVTSVLGAYFVLLPKSRVLILVPPPAILTEAPALFFLGLWWLVHLATFAVPGAQPLLLAGPAASFCAGAVACLLARSRVVWE